MKAEKKIFKSASVVAGALLSTALLAAPANGMDILAFNDLGSGAELRTKLVEANTNQSSSTEVNTVKYAELKCGEDGKKEEKKAEGKKSDAKTKSTKKGDAKTETKAKEEKTKEAKCGEGTCG